MIMYNCNTVLLFFCVFIDSLALSLTIDILEERVTEMEKRLNDTITRIFKLESLLPIISLQVKDTDDSYNFSDSDDVPPLPPPVVPPVIPPPAPVVPTPPTAGQYYMPAAPMYLHQTGQPPYFQHTSPLHPVELSKYYSSPPNVTPPMPSSIPPPTPSSVPKCLPIQGKRKKDGASILPSIEINKENLSPCDIILKKYSTLHNEKAIGTLAVKLASESFFGNEVLKKCTVMGLRDFPALPTKELNELKQVIFSLFPKYWNNVAEFEFKIWNLCSNSIGQLCKRLRAE